jgi:anthranilate/para-aminobenzoate synthase component I
MFRELPRQRAVVGRADLIAPNWMRLYLAIRGLVLVDGMAHAQAGAGIIHDSDPDAEYAECLAKLRAPLGALELPLELL